MIFSPLMPINCLVNQRDKESKRQETKRRRAEEIKRNKPFNGSAMNSPPTQPYCGSVAAALHLMNSQIRCGSCREKVYGVFYKLRDKKCSKESAYVLVGFLARPFVSFVSHIARYAPSSTDKSSSLRNQKQENVFSINAH